MTRCKIIIDANEENICNLVVDIKRIIDIYKYDAKVE